MKPLQISKFLTGVISFDDFWAVVEGEISDYKNAHLNRSEIIQIKCPPTDCFTFQVGKKHLENLIAVLKAFGEDRRWLVAYICEAILLCSAFEYEDGIGDALHEISEICLSAKDSLDALSQAISLIEIKE